jgi:nucleoside-diphosphate-sugar epimerase
MKILVTGGNGFIGSHVVDNLLKKGHKVTIFTRHKEISSLWDKKVSCYLGDVKDAEAVNDAVSHHDGVINLAGILGTAETVSTPIESIEVNILGAINVFEAIKKHKIPSVQITVGNYTWHNTYAITKYSSERFAHMYNNEFKTKISVVRGLNVYGERQKHYPIRKVVPNFVLPALKNEPIVIFGDGQQLLDLIYAKDVAEIIARSLLLEHNHHQDVFEAGSGLLGTVTSLAETIIRLSGSKSEIKYVPMRFGEPVRSITRGDPSTLEPLGFRDRDFTPLEVGLKKTIDWYKKNLSIFSRDLAIVKEEKPKKVRSKAKKATPNRS